MPGEALRKDGPVCGGSEWANKHTNLVEGAPVGDHSTCTALTKNSQEIEGGKYSVVVVGPKLLLGEKSPVRVLFSQAHFSKKVLGLIVDEAHCIVQWGDDFRPEYASLSTLRALLSVGTSVQAFSATMPPGVLAHTHKSLLIDPVCSFLLNLGNNRANISWHVVHMTAGKTDLESLQILIPDDVESLTMLPKTMVFFDDILQSLKARRWLVERLPATLHKRVRNYNARMDDLSKAIVMEEFRNGQVDILFTTEAAGMVRLYQSARMIMSLNMLCRGVTYLILCA